MPSVGMTSLLLASASLDVAKDQLPSPWSLGVPAGKDICQRESWQLYFLFHPGLSLIHPSCSFPHFFSLFVFYSPRSPTFPLSVRWSSSLKSHFLFSIFSFPEVLHLPCHSLASLHVDDILVLHRTVPANWATAWRHAGGQQWFSSPWWGHSVVWVWLLLCLPSPFFLTNLLQNLFKHLVICLIISSDMTFPKSKDKNTSICVGLSLLFLLIIGMWCTKYGLLINQHLSPTH